MTDPQKESHNTTVSPVRELSEATSAEARQAGRVEEAKKILGFEYIP